MGGGPSVVLICRGDQVDVGQAFAAELQAAGYEPQWDGLWEGRSQKQRARLRRQAAEKAHACAILLAAPMPNTRQLQKASAAFDGISDSRLIAVLLPGGPAPTDIPDEWLQRVETPLDLRNAPAMREAARAFAGVLRGVAPPTEYALASGIDSGTPTTASTSDAGGGGRVDVPTAKDEGERKYRDDRKPFERLRQWFAPLPKRPDLQLLEREELAKGLPDLIHEKVAEQLLEEAAQLMNTRDDRVRAAEAKATTLMGTVAIAASLVIAGSGLILDSTKVTEPWRQALMGLVAALLFFLLMCGYTASRGLLRVLTVRRPQTRAALKRAARSPNDVTKVMRNRAIDMFDRAGRNRYVADYKVEQLRVADRWYQLALAVFLPLGLTLLGYALFGDIRPRG
jgi:hypothetical protein